MGDETHHMLASDIQISKVPLAAAKATRFSKVHSHPASRSRSSQKFTLQM